ncbi:MAG TPA: helix-turn-helix domain-containing protein [Gammaproteobacteria bacterium]|nr:helix-turn-helix domain-containing protein [Gammaproteobacteria bacterium]
MIEQTKLLYRPDRVSAPGVTLLDLLEERGMTQAELAERTGRPLKTINEIIKGKAAITSETAIQLERALGTPAEFWSQREANYRAYLARQKELEHLAAQKDWLKQFPIKEMKKRGWLQECGNAIADHMISILNFFGVAAPDQWERGWTQRRLAFRKAMNLKSDIGAISVWLRQGELEGEKIHCKSFNREKLISSLEQIRELTKERDPEIFIPKLMNICADCGIAVAFVKPFAKVPVYGASCWLHPEKALVQLSLRGKTADILWFTFFHEIGHIIKHSKKEFFIEIDDKTANKSPEEVEADEYAAETLIPASQLNAWLKKNDKLNAAVISNFAKQLNIAPGILVGRLQHMNYVKYSEYNRLKFRYDWREHEEHCNGEK